MKTKKIVAVSSALMIGTTTALTGFPAVVLAQENMQEAVTSEQEEKYTKVSVKNPVADSEELTGEGKNNGRAQHAFDGNESTVWHTLWSQDGQKKNAALDQLQSGSGDQDRKNRLSGKTGSKWCGKRCF